MEEVVVGLWSKLFSRGKSPVEQIKVSVSVSSGDLVQVAGTTTFAKQGAVEVAGQLADQNRGYAELRGQVVGANSDEMASTVEVFVDGVRIGALPSYKARELSLKHGETYPILVQLFLTGGLGEARVDAWAWVGSGPPRWRYGPSHRPPVTTLERAEEAHGERRRMVDDGLAGGGDRAEQFRAGLVNGVHYLELVEPIKQLKREGKLEEALQLCYQAIEGAENDRGGREPAPAYTIDAAIICRKLKRGNEEIAVLQRWLEHCPLERRSGSRVAERLGKLSAN